MTHNEQTTLKPCKFCGGESMIEEFRDGDDPQPLFVATCKVCPVKTYDQFTAEEAARIWNTRVSAASTAPVVDELIEAFRDASIKAHIGFNHVWPWEECRWIECEDRRKMLRRVAAASPAAPTLPIADQIWNACKEIVYRINFGEHNHPDLANDTALTWWLAAIVTKHFESAAAIPTPSPADAAQESNPVIGELKQALLERGIQAHWAAGHVNAWADCEFKVCDDVRKLLRRASSE